MNIILKTVFNSKRLQFSLLILSLLLPGTGLSAFYKWIDDEGKTHYGSQRPVSQSAEKIKLKIQQPDTEQKDDTEAKENPEQKAQPTPDILEETEPQLSAKEKKRLCQQAKDDVIMIEARTRIRERDKDGNVRYLTERERSARLALAKKDLRDMCR